MTRLRVVGGVPLQGAAEPPPDPAIAQIALVLAALADGETRLMTGDAGAGRRLDAGQIGRTIDALRALGAAITVQADAIVVRGRGRDAFAMPRGAIDCGRSELTLALMAGLLAGQRFGTRLLFDAASGPPELDHLVGSLRARGAQIAGAGSSERVRPPLAVAPLLERERLRGIECALPAPDPLAKSALLLSGLYAAGPTAVSEPLLSPDHVERMLTALEVPLRRFGSMAGFDPNALPAALPALGSVQLPGSVAAAAAASAVVCSLPSSRVALHAVAFNPTRAGFFDALRLLGANLRVIAKGDRAGREPIASVQVQHARVRGGTLGGELVLRAGDTLPALCLVGASSGRGLELLDAEHYARAGSALWTQLAELIAAFGAEARVAGAGLAIAPAERLVAARLDAAGDHRLALTAVLLGLAAEGETCVDHADCIEDEWPGLLTLLRALGARISLEPNEDASDTERRP